jgi:hypothetical protein
MAGVDTQVGVFRGEVVADGRTDNRRFCRKHRYDPTKLFRLNQNITPD